MRELPKGWEEMPLGEIGVWRGGGTPSKANSAFWSSGDIPWVSPKDMKTDLIGGAEDHITAEAVACSATQLIPERSVLVVTRSGILRRTLPVGLTTREVAINQDLKALTPNSAIDPEFVTHQVRSSGNAILSTCAKSGTTVDSIDFERLKAFRFLVPPLPEQRRIAAKIDSLTGKSKRARDHLDHIPRLVEKYKQAVLAAAFRGDLTKEWRETNAVQHDYEAIEVSQLANVVTGSTPPTKNKGEYFGGNIPFVKPTDLDVGYHVEAVREMLTDEGAAVSRPVPSGSTLVTCIGATIAKTGFARVACCTNQQINALVPDRQKVIPEWLYWMVISPDFRQSILDNSSATTLPIINKSRFQELLLPSVPLLEQGEVVRRLETAFTWIDRLAFEVTSARKLVDRLDQAVLAKAFRGELVPQDPADEPASVLLERITAKRSAAPKTGRDRRRAEPVS